MTIAPNWDTIIVGGGSAGAIVAGILAQRDPSEKILLLEAGRSDRHPLVQTPLGLVRMMGDRGFDWCFESVPSDSQGQAITKIPRGKMLGGSGSINSMLYIRGRPSDYDEWAEAHGAAGWAWRDVLPVFKRMEQNRDQLDETRHGFDGPMHVENQASPHPLTQHFFGAGRQLQIPGNQDFNGSTQEGLGLYQCNMKNGRRWTGVDAYLRPAIGRSNLAVETNVNVRLVQLSGRKATGVVLNDGRAITANRRVILCAGAIGTPSILLRSGIGPQGHALHLAGVGQNLQDHPAAPISYKTANIGHGLAWRNLGWILGAPFQYMARRRGMLASPTVEAGGFVKTDSSQAQPDVQFHFGPFNLSYWGHGLFADACVLKPYSRGQLALNADGSPSIDLNLLSDERDADTLFRGWRLLAQICQQMSQNLAGQPWEQVSPGLDPNDSEALRRWLKSSSYTSYHPVGTAKMGLAQDPMAVVHPGTMGVHGSEGLFVVDASVMPTLVAGNTNNPTMMIAEKSARELL